MTPIHISLQDKKGQKHGGKQERNYGDDSSDDESDDSRRGKGQGSEEHEQEYEDRWGISQEVNVEQREEESDIEEEEEPEEIISGLSYMEMQALSPSKAPSQRQKEIIKIETQLEGDITAQKEAAIEASIMNIEKMNSGKSMTKFSDLSQKTKNRVTKIEEYAKSDIPKEEKIKTLLSIAKGEQIDGKSLRAHAARLRVLRILQNLVTGKNTEEASSS
jgi:hypothetical protein